MDDIQVIIHLGDYIYEYEPNKYGDESFYRKHLPPKEILTVDDYRTRYAQYRLDPGLRKAHQMHPFITVYDDHEIANNAYQTGAENHQPESEGDFGERKEAAVKVWYEWMPVLQGEFYPYVRRTFDFGNKAKLIMLDLRLEGRQEQAEAIAQVSPDDSDQTILGQSQRDWLVDQLTNSDAQWNIIGNSVTFGSVDYSEVVGREDLSVNMDAWSGYPYDQDHITEALARDGSRKTFFITGDTHTSYAMEIPNAYGKFPYQSVAVEFGAPGLTSPSYFTSRFSGEEEMKEGVLKGTDFNKHLKYINTRDKGFLVVSLGVSEGKACWHYLEDIKNADTPVKEVRCYRFKEGILSSEK
jgi:alkaline phosphatase D